MKPYNYLVSAPTFTGAAGRGAAGSCGPFTAALTSNFATPNNAINCAGSLLSDDLGAFGGRSEVQVDGANAYDAASAQALFSGGRSPVQSGPSRAFRRSAPRSTGTRPAG